jgi:glutamate synthase domain-containing protein 2
MASEDRAVDFITVDGGEGGTGAAPLVFTDHVALPFKMGIARVYSAFAREGIADRVTFIGSGKLGFPEAALFAFALGCDMVNVGREAMLAIGCVQAQICHTGECPVGVATQSRWLTRALVPGEKRERSRTTSPRSGARSSRCRERAACRTPRSPDPTTSR